MEWDQRRKFTSGGERRSTLGVFVVFQFDHIVGGGLNGTGGEIEGERSSVSQNAKRERG